jgi:hypothetical protein
MSKWNMEYFSAFDEHDVHNHVITAEDVERSSTLDEHDIGKQAIYANGAIVCFQSIKHEVKDA